MVISLTTLLDFVKLGVFPSDFFQCGAPCKPDILMSLLPYISVTYNKPLSLKTHYPDGPGDVPGPLTSFVPTQKPAYSSAFFPQIQNTLNQTIPQSL